MEGYTFKAGGADWTIEIGEDIGKRWDINSSQQIITLATKMKGKPIRQDVIIRHMWSAIYDLIHYKIQYKEGKIWDKFFMAVSNQVANTIPRLGIALPKEGSDLWLMVGGANYRIFVDNLDCEEHNRWGQCDPNLFQIVIQTEEKGVKFHPQFVRQTVLHEILHAINYEVGLQGTKWDSEEHVNTTSILLSEVWHTLQPIKTTEDAANTEDPKAEEG